MTQYNSLSSLEKLSENLKMTSWLQLIQRLTVKPMLKYTEASVKVDFIFY